MQGAESKKELHFVGSLIAHGPYARADRYHRQQVQWDEANRPGEVALRFELIAHNQLEHEQNDVRVEADEHGFELHKVVSFESKWFLEFISNE